MNFRVANAHELETRQRSGLKLSRTGTPHGTVLASSKVSPGQLLRGRLDARSLCGGWLCAY